MRKINLLAGGLSLTIALAAQATSQFAYEHGLHIGSA